MHEIEAEDGRACEITISERSGLQVAPPLPLGTRTPSHHPRPRTAAPTLPLLSLSLARAFARTLLADVSRAPRVLCSAADAAATD
eukprot:4493561-Prymnesium_polylepis.2